MAMSKSGLYLHTIGALFLGTSITGGPISMTATTPKLALLLGASVTDGSSPVNFSTSDSHWVNTAEATGTGWSTGGIAVSALASGGTSGSPTFAEGTTGSLRYDHTNDTSVASTTVSNFSGGIFYYDAATSPADLTDAMIVAIYFGGTFSTVAGTLGIQWAATGIFEIDLTP